MRSAVSFQGSASQCVRLIEVAGSEKVNVPLHNAQRCCPEQERSLAQIKSPIRFGQEARRPNPKRRGC